MQNATGLSRTIFSKDRGFVRVEVTDAERERIDAGLRDRHIVTMLDCFRDAIDVIEHYWNQPTKAQIISVATALFEKRASASFTAEAGFLERKIFSIKNGDGDGLDV